MCTAQSLSCVLCSSSNGLVGVLDSCLSNRSNDHFSHHSSALRDLYLSFWQALPWQMDSRPDIVLGGLNHWLWAVGFRRGEDWITPGGSRSKTGEASLTLRHIMNQLEVPVSHVRGCRSGEEGKKEGNGKVKNKGGRRLDRVMEKQKWKWTWAWCHQHGWWDGKLGRSIIWLHVCNHMSLLQSHLFTCLSSCAVISNVCVCVSMCPYVAVSFRCGHGYGYARNM